MFSWGPGKVWLSMLLVAAVLGSPASSSGITEAPADEGPPLWPGAECSRSLVRVERSDLERAYRAMVGAEYTDWVLDERGWSRLDVEEPLLRLANADIFGRSIDSVTPQKHDPMNPNDVPFLTSNVVFDDVTRDGGISPLDMYAMGGRGSKCPRGAADGCRHSLDPERVLFFGGTYGGGRTSMLVRRGAIEAIATNDPWMSKEHVRYITLREGDIEAALEKDRQTTTVMVTSSGGDAESLRTIAAWRLIQDHYPGVQVEFWLPGDHAKEWDAAEKANARADDMGRIDTSKPVPIRLCRLAARITELR